MTTFLMIICAFLISMNLIFITIELKSRFDKSFLLIGIANLLLSFFCIIDILIQPKGMILEWTLIQHIIVSFLPPFLIWHIMVLTNKFNQSILKGLFLCGFIFAVFFMSGHMLKSENDEIISTFYYNITFAPCTFFLMIYSFHLSFSGLRSIPKQDRKELYFYIAGIFVLFTGGTLDLISVFIGYRFFMPIISCTVLGTMGFSILLTITFANKLSAIIKEREMTFAQLKDAYKELEDVRTLKELGQSTAIINHEIRNYASVISGYSEILKMNPALDSRTKTTVDKISECVVRLTAFSNDILEFSKSKVLKNKANLDLSELIEQCVDLHFQKHKNSFTIEHEKDQMIILGDKTKLERVFINMFKNSFEAKAQNISVRLSKNESVVLCIIEDDGVGCSQGDLGSVFKSFYTTKKSEGGTGLGMCVVRSIIEVHGGYISAYSRNNSETGSHGFSLHITFPAENIIDKKDNKSNIILIKNGINDLTSVLRVFHNMHLSPSLVQNAFEIDTRAVSIEEVLVIASPTALNQFRSRFQNSGNVFALVEGSENMLYVIDEKAESQPTLFCEEFLFNQISD
ncbi:MAG: HAMP domain-containing histidine kinase [Fibrobacter sp.]|nr:HAMP domain-containing histidine kinase [Fibrobacter sp.]